MRFLSESIDQSKSRSVVEPALRQLAERFETLWHRAHGARGEHACARLAGETLIFSLENVLTTAQRSWAGTDEGYASLVRTMAQQVDVIYPQLADQIETVLHCYVGAMYVEVEPENGTLHIKFQLRDAPRALYQEQLPTSCR